MTYEAKSYEHLKGGALKGFSDGQLELHFTLYKGYLAKINEIEDKLAVANNTKPNYSFNEYSELKRREAVAFNGTFLHELYFENLGFDATISPALQAALDAQGGKDQILADLKGGGPGRPRLGAAHAQSPGRQVAHLLRGRTPPGHAHRAGPADGAG